jgi:ATPase family associated with various cellular activities (AAA)
MTAPFEDLPPTPANHFRLYYFAAVSRLMDALVVPSPEALLQQFPMFATYREELQVRGALGQSDQWWQEALEAWEAGASLPLKRLRQSAALDHHALTLLLCVGLSEEDSRFALMFEALNGTRRPTLGLLNNLWRDAGHDDARAALDRLRLRGLVRVSNPDAPRADWTFEPSGLLWDALCGRAPALPAGLRHRPMETLLPLEELVLDGELRTLVERLPPLLQAREVRALIVRGSRHGGRRTLVGALARRLGKGLLEVEGAPPETLGTLALLVDALPVVVVDPAPGECVNLSHLPGDLVAVVLGRQGAVDAGEGALAIELPLPDPGVRRVLWSRAPAVAASRELEQIAERFHFASGQVRRASALAQSHAALAGRAEVLAEDVRAASRGLDRQALDTLALRVQSGGDWSHLAVAADTQRDLADLERRCRHRERLAGAVGASVAKQLRRGVCALFRGPSGSGKTLAARLLASSLGMDLYKVDLASVVNKYIGETEKNLSRAFALAEELDVMLLFDEGDALFARRTSVTSSNDRYANLETNYLLQRIETFDGILLCTTNAGESIDSAFSRRMDVTVDFRAPEASERWTIWHLHLPEGHAVDPHFLRDVSVRCALSGGQIRNAVLHSAMLALDHGARIGDEHLEAAVQREYRKSGAICPLRRVAR